MLNTSHDEVVLGSLLDYFTKEKLFCIHKLIRTPVCKDSQRQCLQLTQMETHPRNALTADARLAVGHAAVVRGAVVALTPGFESLHSKHHKDGVHRAVLGQQSHFSHGADK